MGWTKARWKKWKIARKMIDSNPIISIILNMNNLKKIVKIQ